MDDDVRGQKATLRAELLQRLKAQSPEERLRQSRRITEQVLQSTAFQRARVLLGYSALPYEVATDRIIDAALALGKRVALPRVMPASRTLVAHAIRDPQQDLEPGPHGISQPKASADAIPLETIDLVIVPGVGFDRQGHRLGHGQGYYDRLLRQLPATTPRLGLAFACQLVARIPATAHDVPVTTLLSDSND